MTVRVLDASAVVLLVAGGPGMADIRRQLADTISHAPHLIDAECGHVFRRAVRRDAWLLRDQLSYYDALYVALAVRLDVPLVTSDRRLAGAPDLPCPVELVG